MSKAAQTPKPRRVPERHCIGCGEPRPKKELMRVVRAPDGSVSLDFTGKKPGRGAYLCPSSRCFRKARKAGRLASALDTAIPEELYNILESEIALSEKEADTGKGEP